MVATHVVRGRSRHRTSKTASPGLPWRARSRGRHRLRTGDTTSRTPRPHIGPGLHQLQRSSVRARRSTRQPGRLRPGHSRGPEVGSEPPGAASRTTSSARDVVGGGLSQAGDQCITGVCRGRGQEPRAARASSSMPTPTGA
jgi:hypothetical protein